MSIEPEEIGQQFQIIPTSSVATTSYDSLKYHYSPPNNEINLVSPENGVLNLNIAHSSFNLYLPEMTPVGVEKLTTLFDFLSNDPTFTDLVTEIVLYKEPNGKPRVLYNPNAIDILKDFFDKFIPPQGLVNITTDLSRAIQKQYALYDKAAAVEPNLVEHALRLRGVLWRRLQPENIVEEMQDVHTRSQIHESQHYISLQRKFPVTTIDWVTDKPQIVAIPIQLSRFKPEYLQLKTTNRLSEQDLSEIQNYTRLQNLFYSFLELEAYIHEILGTQIIGANESYSHRSFLSRMGGVLSSLSNQFRQMPFIQYTISEALSLAPRKQNELFSEHTFASLALLFLDELRLAPDIENCTNLETHLNLNGLDLKNEILRRIEITIENPTLAEQLVKDAYDFTQLCLDRLLRASHKAAVNIFNNDTLFNALSSKDQDALIELPKSI